ncbi:unnamed protein product [Coffea canephora]|uniref:Uncharacterized protein n=1 Tax=Coffea canephora TaxID=49390 RepID=A0A068UXR4_COFCA|nr:unnamed protein product [Coffea canephora]
MFEKEQKYIYHLHRHHPSDIHCRLRISPRKPSGNDFRHWRKKIVKMEIILILAVILMIMRTKGRRANLSPPLGLKVTGNSVFSSEALGFLKAVIFIWYQIFSFTYSFLARRDI